MQDNIRNARKLAKAGRYAEARTQLRMAIDAMRAYRCHTATVDGREITLAAMVKAANTTNV